MGGGLSQFHTVPAGFELDVANDDPELLILQPLPHEYGVTVYPTMLFYSEVCFPCFFSTFYQWFHTHLPGQWLLLTGHYHGCQTAGNWISSPPRTLVLEWSKATVGVGFILGSFSWR